VRPNNSFKPTPHRGVNSVLCATLHAVATPLRGGLTQALGVATYFMIDFEKKMNQTKPAEYYLQISIDSLRNECVLNLESTAPFNVMSVGEKFFPAGDTSHWFPDGSTPKVLYVVDIAHSVMEHPTAILNQMMVALSSKAP
jgi:hypothetical protein